MVTLYTYERDSDDGDWRFAFSCPAVIGKNGLAWGEGLHSDRDRPVDDPVKREGDGCSPQGVFALTESYGELPPSMMRVRFPYTRTDGDMACVDDVRSEYYNMVVAAREAGLDPQDMPSHEDMVREDGLYRFVVFVAHNYPGREPGAGSCIFLHVWGGPGTFTAGCTAVEEDNMVRLIGWLDPDKNPCLVQLARKNYHRLKDVWKLPDINI